MLEGGRSYAAVSKDCTCKKIEKKAGAIHDVDVSEVRILHQAKLELEQQLKGKKLRTFLQHRFLYITRFYSIIQEQQIYSQYFFNDAEALSKQHDAMSQAVKLAARNEELEKELRDLDHVALAVEADCNSAVKENNRRVCRLQVITTNALVVLLFTYLFIHFYAYLGKIRRCNDTSARLRT